MPTLLLTPRYTEDSQKLWRAAIELGWDVERLTKWQISDRLSTISEPVLYLEGLMAGMVAQQFDLKLVEPAEDWLTNLAKSYRKREIKIATFAEARQLKECAFIKPPNQKSFPAAIYKGGELPEGYPDDSKVLISEIVQWEKEFRCFILNRNLKTFSIYLRVGVLQQENNFQHSQTEERELIEFVNKLLAAKTVELPSAIVLDVGVIKDRGWAVVELNAAWGSGIYGCNPQKVLEVLRYSVIKE